MASSSVDASPIWGMAWWAPGDGCSGRVLLSLQVVDYKDPQKMRLVHVSLLAQRSSQEADGKKMIFAKYFGQKQET